MSPLPTSVRLVEALYGLVLRLLSPRLLSRHGRDMRAMFREIALEAHRDRGVPGVVHAALATLTDLFVHLLRRGGRSTGRRGRQGTTAAPAGGLTGQTFGRGRVLMNQLVTDILVAGRSLRRRPTLLMVASLTLALGIGANTAVFSVVWGAWLKPLPYPDAERLVRIGDVHQSFEPGGYSTVSIGNYVDMKEQNRTFESTTLFTFVPTTLEDGRELMLLYAEPSVLRTLGVSPIVGRDFSAEDPEGDASTVILSHGLWSDAFGGSRDAIGQELVMFERRWSVIGVAPEGLDFPREVDAIIPFRWSEAQRNAHGGRSMYAMGRLLEGVSMEAARADLQAIYVGIAERYPGAHEGWTAGLSSFREFVVGRDHAALRLMSWAALLLLLITCANVASLLLTRAESRKREVAVRAALGAGRTRVLTVFLGESLLLGLFGGVLGVAVAVGGIDLLVSIFGSSLRRPSEIGLNGSTLAVASGLTLATIVAVALVPGFRLDVARLGEVLREGTSSVSRGGLAAHRLLVLTEIVLAVVLVCGAGLLLNTMWRLTRADLGFDAEGAVAAYLELPDRYRERGEQDRLYRLLTERLGSRPEIAAVGAGDRVPPDGNITDNGFQAVGRPETSTDFVVIRQVTPGYFRAAGIPFVAGVTFDWLPPTDSSSASPLPAVINRKLAESLFPEGGAVGRLVENEHDRYRIVGVVESVHQRGANEPAPPAIYHPWPAVPLSFASRPVVLLRARDAAEEGESAALAGLRSTLEEIDPEIHLSARSLREGLDRLYLEQEFALSLMGIFAGLALVLGVVGLYGIISFTVAQRTREVGIRMALGAARSRVVRLILRQGMTLTILGVGLGLVAAAALGRFLARLLYQVSPMDATTYAAVGALFLGTAALACVVPARRASRVDPAEVLRAE